MSNRPQAFGLYDPTLHGRPRDPLTLAWSGASVSPNANWVRVPARQAYSHSASVGSRYLRPALASSGAAESFAQKSTASAHSTPSTGKSPVSMPLTASFLLPVGE